MDGAIPKLPVLPLFKPVPGNNDEPEVEGNEVEGAMEKDEVDGVEPNPKPRPVPPPKLNVGVEVEVDEGHPRPPVVDCVAAVVDGKRLLDVVAEVAPPRLVLPNKP